MEVESVEEQPVNMVRRVADQILSQGLFTSPMLNAIQEIDGSKAGEKYCKINKIVRERSKKDAESSDSPLNVPAQMRDFVSTKVDIERKSIDAIVRCLTSEDKTLTNQALRAKWFFNHDNPHLNVDFFSTSIIPNATEYTLFRIIKALSHCLVHASTKAEDFFTFFANLCGSENALPLLAACSEDFIYDEVMKRKLFLSSGMLLSIYKRHPKFLVRYLNLGDSSNKKYDEVRKIHSINLYNYHAAIPHLIRHDIEYFIELVDSFKWIIKRGKIGSTLTSLFFKKATHIVLEKPAKFMGIWPMKVFSTRLTRKQYETMYFNLLPERIDDFRSSFSDMINYLKGYPLEKRYHLISSQFKLKYQTDFETSIQNIKIEELNEVYDHLSVELYEKWFIMLFPERHLFKTQKMLDYLSKYPKEKRLNLLLQTFQLKYGEDLLNDIAIEQIRSDELFKLLPLDVKITLARKVIETYEVKSTDYYNNYYLLPMSECFPIYKEAIQKSSDESNRWLYIEKMCKSCAIYNSMEDLLQVINYYNVRHANEKRDIFVNFLTFLEKNFDLKEFGEQHWIVILGLFQKLSIKGELSNIWKLKIKPFFVHAIFSVYDNETKLIFDSGNKKTILTMFCNLLIDYNVENSSSSQIWTLSEKNLNFQKACFDSLLQCFPTKYPPEHYVWKENGISKKLHIVTSILDSMNLYNNNVRKLNLSKTQQVYEAKEYPWLLNIIKEILDSKNDLHRMTTILKKHSLELYKSLTGESNVEINISSGSAWKQLKTNYSDVLMNWREYLNQCRTKLLKNSKRGGAAARRFLLSAKWYNTLPINFVEESLREITEPGSLKVLAILLDSEEFTLLATAFAPNESFSMYPNAKEYFSLVKSIPPAIIFVNPPIAFDVVTMYCQGNYTPLAVQAFEHVTHLVSRKKVVAFANVLINKPVSVKKHGIRLLCKAVHAEELRLFTINFLKIEKNPSIRELICNICQERLIKLKNEESWRLVQTCISALKVQDEACLYLFGNVSKMKNSYIGEYTTEFVKKIDELSKDPEFAEGIKIRCIVTLLNSFRIAVAKHLPEDIIFQLLEKYYFDTDSSEISAVAQSFGKKIFSDEYIRQMK